MKELIEWMEANVDSATDDNGHSIPVLHYDELIAKAKELQAIDEADNLSTDELLSEFNRQGFDTSNWDGEEGAEKAIVDGVVDHIQELQADGRNNSQYLRQNHSDDTLDMRDPLAEAWDSEEDKIWDTLDMHTFKVGDRVRVVSNQASMANENCGRHEFEIGAVVELRYWSDGSKSWEAKNKSDCWNIDPADIEPCQKEFRWEEKLNNLLATKSKAELLEVWDRVNKERKKGPALSDYFEKLEE
jgi:hypothetical protein